MSDPGVPTRVHAFGDDALGHHDAVGLVEALHRGEVTVPEVVAAAIARSERLDAALGGIAHRDHDRARARALDPGPGYFAGVPTYVKDNCALAGTPTQDGSDAFVAPPARHDGDLARMLLATGLVPLGKSQLSELGFSGSAEHPRLGSVRSPWDPRRTAGASSAGAAVLVAGGAVPLAHANDGGGSIRIPASVNGLVGLKPTRGRLAQDRVFREMPLRIVGDGVLTRSVRDTAAFLREAERVYRALRLPPVGDVTRPGRARLRIGVATALDRPAGAEVAALTRATADLLADLGHHVEEVGREVMPPRLPEDFLLYWAFLAMVLVRTGRRTHGRTWDPTRLDRLTHHLDRHAVRRLHRLPTTLARLRSSTRAASAAFHRDHDVLLTPTLAHETPYVGHLDPRQDPAELLERLMAWVAFTPLQNASGEPSVSLPLATTAAGLPQGMMLTAADGREALLLELALELEQARPFASITA